ncbi:MDR family MFS transporter [Sulfobacillus harzensis]|uniref:MFS transporter n=1 Tax=Sulfobacillus harzensis TaxID=2729629 RepID=A0A7Y0L6P5_9FIRM|nr:MDR family MFS transporter [Sulfobacillus harzensis]NMP22929.1 MFS transporter [Sulfobacillus harzensis]
MATVQETNRITGPRRWWVLVAVLITMFFSSMDQTVVSTAMPTIIGDLKGLTLYAWVFTAYMMASSVTVPIYGKMSDVYGRKPFYIFGLIAFMVGSAISGTAHSMMALILSRAGQGIGAGAMMSMPRATIGDIFNPRERGRWMGIIGGVFGLASIIGPALGGWITDNFGWRWVFYINLPIAFIALVLVWAFLPRVRTAHKATPDLVGSLILVVGLLAVLLGFTWAGSTYPWGSWQVISLFAGGGLVLLGFVLYELHTKDPVLNPTLFKNPIFSSSMVVGLMVSMGLFGSLMFLPLFVQGVIGLSASGSGVILTPMMLSFIVASMIGGQLITRTGRYKWQAHISALVMILGMVLLTRMSASTKYPTVIVNMIVLGLGVGTLMPLLNVAVQNAFPYKILGMVNSTQQFVSSLGGVIASPILGSLMTGTFTRELPRQLPPHLKALIAKLPTNMRVQLLNPQALATASAQKALAAKFAHIPGGTVLYQQFLHAFKVSLSMGIVDLFKMGIAFSVVAFVGTFFLREVKLKRDEFFEDKAEKSPSMDKVGGAKR